MRSPAIPIVIALRARLLAAVDASTLTADVCPNPGPVPAIIVADGLTMVETRPSKYIEGSEVTSTLNIWSFTRYGAMHLAELVTNAMDENLDLTGFGFSTVDQRLDLETVNNDRTTERVIYGIVQRYRYIIDPIN